MKKNIKKLLLTVNHHHLVLTLTNYFVPVDVGLILNYFYAD